jgi:hypothetical protein
MSGRWGEESWSRITAVCDSIEHRTIFKLLLSARRTLRVRSATIGLVGPPVSVCPEGRPLWCSWWWLYGAEESRQRMRGLHEPAQDSSYEVTRSGWILHDPPDDKHPKQDLNYPTLEKSTHKTSRELSVPIGQLYYNMTQQGMSK